MTTAVFDTNVYLQAALSMKGPAYACWQLVLSGDVQVYLTPQIIIEIRRTFRKPQLSAKFPSVHGISGLQLIRNFRRKSTLLFDVPESQTSIRDIDDAKFLDLAIATGAEFLVTRDRDLLDLCKESAFMERFPDLNIVTPVGFLEAVRAI